MSTIPWPVFIIIVVFTSCAGPISPFGAIDVFNPPTDAGMEIGHLPTAIMNAQNETGLEPQIHFFPSRKLWHRSHHFKITIFDPSGIPFDHQIQIFFDKKDMTHEFLRHAKSTIDQDKNTITYSFRFFKYKIDQDSELLVHYRPSKMEDGFLTEYKNPECSIDNFGPLVSTGTFNPPDETIQTITTVSRDENLNPSLMAGLVAQESSFNPMAVSWAKAIGLTQVTPLAEQHIIEKYPHWPRYPKINKMGSFRIKSLIRAGQINETNEWRLNNEYSIRGGANYIHYLKKYWAKKKNRNVVTNYLPNPEKEKSKIILASYNSGAFRVKKSIKKLGSNWLDAPKLKEAKKYVRNIQSYCYHFSHL